MKSINVKRVAAVAAGIAMVGSVMASGLAVSHQGDVSSLVSSIKANMDKVQVVVGTQGADISDGVQAAKIAAVLASVNYASVSGGNINVGDKSVKLETSSGALEPIAASTFPVVLGANGTGTAVINDGYTTGTVSQTITKDTLSDVLKLSQKTFSLNGTSSTYYWEDQITVSNIDASYQEASNSNPNGYGLYLRDFPAGDLLYTIQFNGNGLPVGQGISYSGTPEITMLGYTTGIEYQTALNGSLNVISGLKTSLGKTESVTTTDGYTVTVTDIYNTYQGQNTVIQATVSAKSSSGTVETSDPISAGGSWSFFTNGLTVYIDSLGFDAAAAKYVSTVRVTGAKQKLIDGTAFPLDGNWTVNHVEVDPLAGTYPAYLKYIQLKYGNYNAPPTFYGTVLYGLAQGTVINGPKQLDGTPLYQMELKGFGSTNTIVNTATITATGVGTTGSSALMQASWTARDGSSQVFDATGPQAVIIPNPATLPSWPDVSFNQVAKYAILNGRVLKIGVASQSGNQWNLDVTIGGKTVTVGPFLDANGSTANLVLASSVNPIQCAVKLGSTAAIQPWNVTLTDVAPFAPPFIDGTVPSCDLTAGIVPFGAATLLPSTTSFAPFMDMRDVNGTVEALNGSAGVTYNWPTIDVIMPNLAEEIAIVYDSDVASSTNYQGIRAYYNLSQIGTYGAWNITDTAVGAPLIDLAEPSASIYDANKHHVTAFSAQLDAVGTNGVSIIVPQSQRNTIFLIAKSISGNQSSAAGIYTATVGQTVGNVKVNDIVCSAEAAGSNLYQQTKVVLPETLVSTDAAATADYQIVVGGPWVNLVAQGINGSSAVATAAGASYLIADGQKLLVAGYTAADTVSAADDLITLLKA